ncbi:MAG: hypothetical protein LBH43_16625 [Treponema sp.]|jgi:hypothetical protein|nr:hypothetical protein [Treponema sp.]
MASKKNWLGMLLLLLTFSLGLNGCSSKLEGVWESRTQIGGEISFHRITFSNNNWTWISGVEGRAVNDRGKGTFKIKDNKITFIQTHFLVNDSILVERPNTATYQGELAADGESFHTGSLAFGKFTRR